MKNIFASIYLDIHKSGTSQIALGNCFLHTTFSSTLSLYHKNFSFLALSFIFLSIAGSTVPVLDLLS